jgi:peptidoglycan/LPS O-acetylase OafA/YrhL
MCVVSGHSSPILGLPLLDAGLAVRTFFMISGFYMTLILTSKYHVKNGGYWLFISNRFLRIYPSYLVVLLVSTLFYAAASIKLHTPADRLAYWVDAIHHHRFLPMAGIAFSQVSIFGIDSVAMFDYTPDKGFAWCGTLGDTALRCWRFNFLPHCWSISVELFFYLAAPFLCVARRWVQVGVAAFGLALYITAFQVLPHALADAMTYHFFPFQIGYLMLGVLSFHLLHPLFEKGHVHKVWSVVVLVPLGITILFYGWLPWQLSTTVCIGFGFFAVPLLFNLTRRLAIDRFIGDLSYPMYLSHITCKWLLLALMGVSKKDTAIVSGTQLLVVTVVVSVGLLWIVDYPVDRWRQARVARMLGTQIPKAAPEHAPETAA